MWVVVGSGPDSGRRIRMGPTPFVIGRSDSAGLRLDDPKVSREHASLEGRPDGSIVIADLGSTNGTFVNGARITAPTAIAEHDRIRIGDCVLALQADGEEPLPSPPDRREPGPATLERRILRRAVRRSTVLAGTAVAILVLLITLIATGLLPPRAEERNAPASPVRTLADVVRESKRSVALVASFTDWQLTGWGSGWVYDSANGLIVTNAHVINGGETFAVGFAGEDDLVDTDALRTAEVVGAAPCEDLAVLRVDGLDSTRALSIAMQSEIEAGDPVTSLGFPDNTATGFIFQQSDGSVAVPRLSLPGGINTPAYRNVVQTSAAINAGNSGGPLMNLAGEVVGVASAATRVDVAENQGFAIGSDRVRDVVETLALGRSIGWTGMGLEWRNGRTWVTTVVRGTPAAAEGLGGYPAVLSSVDGQRLRPSLPAYCRAVGNLQTGASATFGVVFEDGYREIEVAIA